MPETSGILLEILLAVVTKLSAFIRENFRPKKENLLGVWLARQQAVTLLNLFRQLGKMLL
jgi:hypothetical protein